MGEYIDIDGVNTWYDEEGTGEPLVLLHGQRQLAVVPGASHAVVVESPSS
jgi:hypothetical protein